MKLKSYLVLFAIAVSIILLLNSGAVAQVRAEYVYKYDGTKFQLVHGALDEIVVGNKDNV